MNRLFRSSLMPVLLIAGAGVAAQEGEPAAWEPGAATIMSRWAEDVSPESVHPEYPRPQMVRERWMNLNGLWEFAVAKNDDEDPPAGRALERRILVPFPVESALSGVMERDRERVWYRRTFEVPREWAGERVLLHFGAVDWEARVWVNGDLVGEHRGGYDPFSFDITDALREDDEEGGSGAQEIVVGVWDPTDRGTQPRGKQVRRAEGIWYTPTTGIWQTVWLEPVARTYIESVQITPSVDRHSVTVKANLGGDNASGCEITVTAERTSLGTTGPANEPIELKLDDNYSQLWSPEEPALYDLTIELKREGETTDWVSSYFAMREIELKDDAAGVPRLFLNGEPCFMVGTLDQGFWPDGLYTAPTDEALRFDIEMTKRMGFNTIRKHVKVESARWYSWCDRLGVLVWQDMPSGDAYIGGDDADLVRSDESARQFESELRAMIRALRNHPSIVMWVPFNEGWGQFDTARITDLIREVDPSRLVNSASGWTDRGTGDVHDIHAYPGPAAPDVENERAGVLGEFGGLGLPIEGHTWSDTAWGYQGMQDEEELARRYERLLRGVYELKEKSGLAAAIYTQITDVETETNGLLTYDRAVVKIDPARVAAANRGEFPELKVAVPAALHDAAIEWRYTTEEPAEGWSDREFDDSGWKSGKGGFGAAGTPGAVIGTAWSTSDIWLRRTFDLERVPERDVRLFIHHDEDAEVYINGVLAAELNGYTTGYEDVSLSEESRGALRAGANTIAIHCRQTRGGQFIDAGFVVVVPRNAQSRE